MRAANRATKPVAYLDVDGTLLRFPIGKDKSWWEKHPAGGAPDQVHEFLEWLTFHFEVRWLTAWVNRGGMPPAACARLAKALDVPLKLLESITNPLGWGRNKTEGIDWKEVRDGREFVWIDDELLREDEAILRANNAFDRWYPVHVNYWADDLIRIKGLLEGRFNIRAAASPGKKPEKKSTSDANPGYNDNRYPG